MKKESTSAIVQFCKKTIESLYTASDAASQQLLQTHFFHSTDILHLKYSTSLSCGGRNKNTVLGRGEVS